MSLLRAAPLFLSLLILVCVSSAATTMQRGREMLHVYPRVTVDIWNKYPGVEVTAHCRSKDTDFGIHGGAPGIDVVTFNFEPNLLMNTLYYCTLTRSPGQGKVQFNVYFFKRDADFRCTSHCTWNVRPDGFHGVDQSSGKEDMFFPWGP